MTDRVFAIAGDWAVGADEVQWILYRRQKGGRTPWKGISFVRSTRDILARCMREKGVPDAAARLLLAGLPETFNEWKAKLPLMPEAHRPVPEPEDVPR